MLSEWLEESVKERLELANKMKRNIQKDFEENRISFFIFKVKMNEIEHEIYELEKTLKDLEKSRKGGQGLETRKAAQAQA